MASRFSRDRSQLVVSCGEGSEGVARKRLLKAAAAKAGLSLSEWARETLFQAAEVPAETLGDRVTRLELRVAKLEGSES